MKKLLILLLASVLITSFSLTAFADKVVKEIDIRNATEIGNYYVVFCGHGASVKNASLAGHVFVAWAEEEPDAVSCKKKAYGMYARDKKSLKLLWDVVRGVPVPGKLVEESFDSTSSATHFLIVRVTKAQYKKSEDVRDKQWKDMLDREYELLVTDCVSFSSHIAKSLGLTVPERDKNMKPSSFIEELIEQNN